MRHQIQGPGRAIQGRAIQGTYQVTPALGCRRTLGRLGESACAARRSLGQRRRTCVQSARCSQDASSHGLGLIVEQSQQTIRSLYLKLLPGPYAYAPSFLVPAASALSIYGGSQGHKLLQLLQSINLQAPDWFPMLDTVKDVYARHPGAGNLLFDTALSLLGVLAVFVAVPAGDLVLGLDPKDAAHDNTKDISYRLMLHSHVLLHWALLVAGCVTASQGTLHPLTLLGMTASVGCDGALIFVVTHELLHSRRPADRLMANLGLAPLAYCHWIPSHISHHRNVSTERDPASARLGETLYAFVPRSVVGNIQDGVASELERLRSRRLPVFSLHNRMVWWVGAPSGLLAAVAALWGPWAAALGIGQALLAIFMLEDVNYIEHYGLRRQRLPSGRYERTDIQHSWNCNWLFTNSVIFSLQRHSHHHANSSLPYQKLKHIPEAPQLPASYSAMMLLALFPGVFFDVMDPRALRAAHKQRN